MENGQLEEYYVIVSSDPSMIIDHTVGSMNVYPNPTDGILYIGGENMNMVKYSLYSIDGRLVQQDNITTSQIDISKQPKGAYLLKIETKESVLQQIVILK